jgi:DNA polymerase III subunit beta
MRFKTLDFKTAFARASRLANNKMKDVYANIRMRVGQGQVEMIAYDGEFLAVSKMQSEEADTLDCLLARDRMNAILSAVTHEEIHITPHEQEILVESGGARFTLMSTNPATFAVPIKTMATSFKLPCRAFVKALRSTEYACDLASNRYQLGGVAIDRTKAELCFVATDGRRLSVVRLAPENVDSNEYTVILPHRACTLLHSMLSTENGDVELMIDSSSVTVKTETLSLHFPLVEGRYPNWRQVVPEDEGDKRFTTVVSSLVDAVRLASVCTTVEATGITFSVEGQELTISSSAADVGSGKIKIPVTTESHESFSAIMNYKYILDFLKPLDSNETVVISMPSQTSPVLMQAGSITGVIMPVARN